MKPQNKHFEKKDIQTHLKHALLQDYIMRWANIIGNAALLGKIKKIHFVDAFAGKGTFDDGDVGSPRIAINNLFRLQTTFYEKYLSSEMKFFIHTIESYPQFQDELDKLKAAAPFPEQIANYKGKFEDHLSTVLKRTTGSPALYFIDPFGYKGVSMSDVQSILSQQSHEVLINVMSYSLVRNFKIENNQKEIAIFFGVEHLPPDISEYIKIVSETESKDFSLISHNLEKLENHIIDFYKTQLIINTPDKTYALSKRIYSTINPNVYFHLVFSTKNRRGLIAMKESMVFFEQARSQIENRYLEVNNLGIPIIDDLFSDNTSFETYSYAIFVKDFLKYFNNKACNYGDIVDHFIQNSPLPFRDKNEHNEEKSFYGYFNKLQKSRYMNTTSKAFAQFKQFDEITVQSNFPDNYIVEESPKISQPYLF